MKRLITSIAKFILLKMVYPHQYKKYAGASIEKNKVIFLEVRNDHISNSMKEVYNRIERDGGFNIKCHFLREGVGGRKENIRRTLAFLKDMATAEYVFLSEANNCFACFDKRSETKVVQLWHGCGAFKKFGLSTADLKFGSSRDQQIKYPLYNNLDLVTVSSEDVVWAYEEAMGINKNTIKATGISRTDVFFDETYVEKAKDKVYEAIPQARDKKIIFYAPTFRGDVSNAKAPDALDICSLKEHLGDRYVLLIKHHPFVKKLPVIPAECRDFTFDVTKTLNIDDLICVGDICISDYSSLVFEYALFNKPILFFAYDLDEYNDWRGFYYDYDELTPGPILYDTDQLIEAIESVEKDFNDSEIKKFKERFMSACDGKATDRIFNEIGMEVK